MPSSILDQNNKMTENCKGTTTSLKQFKKIPIYIVEEHNDALQFIYSAIGGKKLPVEGTTLVHFDAHPDLLIDRKLKGEEARSGRNLLPLLQIENWIVPAAAAGHIDTVVWLRPPWSQQITDGTREIYVGDDPSGYLRVDSKEPYYLSDALYSPNLTNERKFTLTVSELGISPKHLEESWAQNLACDLNISEPYVLDIDLDFFSTSNPFLSLYNNIGLYDRLEPIFNFEVPDGDNARSVEHFIESRERQINELEDLFKHLEENNDLDSYDGERTELFERVSELATAVTSEAARLGERPDWWAVFAGGCTRDQGGLPYHISTEAEIQTMVKKTFRSFLQNLPPPVLITVARSTEDGYCPPEQVEFIQNLVLETLSKVFNTDEPTPYYLTVNTG